MKEIIERIMILGRIIGDGCIGDRNYVNEDIWRRGNKYNKYNKELKFKF